MSTIFKQISENKELKALLLMRLKDHTINIKILYRVCYIFKVIKKTPQTFDTSWLANS